MIKKNESADYNLELKKLNSDGPGLLYFIFGKEDYLRNLFVSKLKERCIGTEEGFGYYKFNGIPDEQELLNAVDTIPFLTEKSFIEVTSCDANKIPESIIKILSELPDYVCVCLAADTDYEPDSRLKAIKFLKTNANCLEFSSQSSDKLFKWIEKRFASHNVKIESNAVQRLVFVSGEYMNGLIPEIEKLSAFCIGGTVTVEDVNRIAHHIPESKTFELANLISEKKYNSAVAYLSEILGDRDNSPLGVIASLGYTFRQLFAVRLAIRQKLSVSEIMKIIGTNSDYRAKLVIGSAKNFSVPQLRSIVRRIVESEYRFKTSQISENEILTDLVVMIIAEDKVGKTIG